MNSAKVPREKTALKKIEAIVPEIYRAFEHGTAKSSDYFRLEKLHRDPHLEAMIVKAHARQHLQHAEHFSRVAFDKLAMCGISFRYHGWQFRLWKSVEHNGPKIPQPGNSSKRQNYFVQPEQLNLFEHKKTVIGPKLHLIILWNLDDRGALERLWLVCPASFNPQTGEINVHWTVELPNPTTAIQTSATPASVPDLIIKPREIKKAKEG
jgi:hypothetical protein